MKAQIEIDGRAVAVVRRRGNRHLRLRLNARGQPTLSVPWHCSQREAECFVHEHRDWLAAQCQRHAKVPTLAAHLQAQPIVSAGGHAFAVMLQTTTGRPYWLADDRRREVLLATANLPEIPEDAQLVTLLRAFANAVVPPRARELAERQNIALERVTVRDQHSRWGSCSSTGNLSLNWRLVLLPSALHDHVIWHELAHRREMNHSAGFWNLLRQWDPATDAHRHELTEWGARLMPLGRKS